MDADRRGDAFGVRVGDRERLPHVRGGADAANGGHLFDARRRGTAQHLLEFSRVLGIVEVAVGVEERCHARPRECSAARAADAS